MKKVFAFLVAAVMSAFIGFGIGTIDHHPKAQETGSAGSSAKKAVNSANSNQGNDSVGQNQSTSASQSSTGTTKSAATTATSTVKVQNSQQAIAVLTAALGYNSDTGYEVLSAAPNDFVIKAVSKSIRAKGGTGTIDIYTVRSNGTYQAQY